MLSIVCYGFFVIHPPQKLDSDRTPSGAIPWPSRVHYLCKNRQASNARWTIFGGLMRSELRKAACIVGAVPSTRSQYNAMLLAPRLRHCCLMHVCTLPMSTSSARCSGGTHAKSKRSWHFQCPPLAGGSQSGTARLGRTHSCRRVENCAILHQHACQLICA
jgi:hypothetical protein